MVFSLYMRISLFFSYISCYNIPYRCFSIYIVLNTPFSFFYFAQIPYIAFPQTVLLYIYGIFPIYSIKHFFLLIFCPDSKFLYLAYICGIKDILFLLVPPQNLCVFLYIVKTLFFLCILPKIIYIAIFLYIFMLSSD